MTDTTTEEAEQMGRFGITRVPAFSYHYKAWRYSNLGDALAQARRDAQHKPPNS